MKYSKNKFRNITFSCIEELIDNMIDDVVKSNNEYYTVNLIANTEIMTEAFKRFCEIKINGFEIDFGIVEINTEEYDDLYYLTFGNDGKLWIEKAWHEDNQWHKAGYLYNNSEITYICECDTNSDIVSIIDSDEILIFNIED